MTKTLCITTKYRTLGELIERMHPFCDDHTLFVATRTMLPVGEQRELTLRYADQSCALRGACTVRGAWPTHDSPYGKPGLRLAIEALSVESQCVFDAITAHRREVTVGDSDTTTRMHRRTPAPSPAQRRTGGKKPARPHGIPIVPLRAAPDTARLPLPLPAPPAHEPIITPSCPQAPAAAASEPPSLEVEASTQRPVLADAGATRRRVRWQVVALITLAVVALGVLALQRC